MAWGTLPESYQRSASGRMEASLGALGSQRLPRWRCTLRPIQNSWNQPTWPSSHKGGFNSVTSGTANCVFWSARSQALIHRNV